MDIGRFTRDIDLVLALDLEGFTEFTDELRTLGWIQEERREHRWRGPSGSIIDLLPAGLKLRQARRITWPKSDFEMGLVPYSRSSPSWTIHIVARRTFSISASCSATTKRQVIVYLATMFSLQGWTTSSTPTLSC